VYLTPLILHHYVHLNPLILYYNVYLTPLILYHNVYVTPLMCIQPLPQSYHEQFDSTVKGLESACVESLAYSLTQGDPRFLCPNHKQIDALGLEVSISGDLSIQQMEVLVLTYMGTVPPRGAKGVEHREKVAARLSEGKCVLCSMYIVFYVLCIMYYVSNPL
jgi:hypothetical protein